MNTLKLLEPGNLVFEAAEEPGIPGVGEALVQVHRIGICGTDIHAFAGKQPFFSYPRILGHELGVEVLEIGPEVTNVKPGDSCAVEPYVNCGHCIACRRGRGNCCSAICVLGVHADGGMRERFILPARKLHPSSRLPYEKLALVEPLAIGAHAIDRAAVEPGETVLVIGAGPIGLSAIQFAQISGARVIVLDVNDARLLFCREQLGVDATINGLTENPVDTLQALTGGDFPTAVFDATGNPRSMMESFQYTAHSARLVFIGLFQGDVTFNDPNFHKRELTLMGSRNAQPEDFTRIIAAMEDGRLDTSPWITHRAPLLSVPSVFASWTKPETGVLKAMISVTGET